MSLRKGQMMPYRRCCAIALPLNTHALPSLKGLSKRVTIIPGLSTLSLALLLLLLRHAHCQLVFWAARMQRCPAPARDGHCLGYSFIIQPCQSLHCPACRTGFCSDTPAYNSISIIHLQQISKRHCLSKLEDSSCGIFNVCTEDV